MRGGADLNAWQPLVAFVSVVGFPLANSSTLLSLLSLSPSSYVQDPMSFSFLMCLFNVFPLVYSCLTYIINLSISSSIYIHISPLSRLSRHTSTLTGVTFENWAKRRLKVMLVLQYLDGDGDDYGGDCGDDGTDYRGDNDGVYGGGAEAS